MNTETILELATKLAYLETPVGVKRVVIRHLESLVKAEKEFMDKPTECVGYIPPRPTPAHDEYVKKLRLLQAMCDENRPASDRLAAYDELQTTMYRDKWKFERAADEEHKKAALAKVVIVTEVESKLDEFLKDREHYRNRCSHDGLAANADYDRRLFDLIKKYIRHTLKLTTL